MGSRSGTRTVGSAYTFDVSGLVSANGVVSVILEMDGGGNDVAFSSAEGPAAPELIVTATPSGP